MVERAAGGREAASSSLASSMYHGECANLVGYAVRIRKVSVQIRVPRLHPLFV